MKSTLRKRGKYWHYDNNRYARDRFRVSLHTSSHEKAKQIQRVLDQQQLSNPWDERLYPREEYLRAYAAQHIEHLYTIKSKPWAIRQHQSMSRFLEWSPDRPLRDFKPGDFEEYIRHRKDAGAGPRTIRYEVQVVRRMFVRAVRDGFAAGNPAEQVDLPSVKAVRAIRPFSREEVGIIFQDHFREDMTAREQDAAQGRYPLLATLWFTGLRVSDVITLTAGDINLDQRVIIKQIRKTGRMLRIPLADALVDILTPILPRSGPIFPKYYPGDSDRRRTDVERNLNHQLKRILDRNDLPHGSLHSFRHGFNQRLFELGLQLGDRQVLLGHSAGGTTQIYTHPNEDLARDYLNRL